MTILIVDDSPENRDVYTLLLEHFGYRVLRAENGWEGVCCARDQRPDLVLMDVAMPVMDGIEATELLKADAGTREIPVLGLSADDDQRTIARGMAAGMCAYLCKPAPPRAVLREIECRLPQLDRPTRGPEPPPRH